MMMETTSADAGGAPPAAASTAARSFDTRWVRIQGDESRPAFGRFLIGHTKYEFRPRRDRGNLLTNSG